MQHPCSFFIFYSKIHANLWVKCNASNLSETVMYELHLGIVKNKDAGPYKPGPNKPGPLKPRHPKPGLQKPELLKPGPLKQIFENESFSFLLYIIETT